MLKVSQGIKCRLNIYKSEHEKAATIFWFFFQFMKNFQKVVAGESILMAVYIFMSYI